MLHCGQVLGWGQIGDRRYFGDSVLLRTVSSYIYDVCMSDWRDYGAHFARMAREFAGIGLCCLETVRGWDNMLGLLPVPTRGYIARCTFESSGKAQAVSSLASDRGWVRGASSGVRDAQV